MPTPRLTRRALATSAVAVLASASACTSRSPSVGRPRAPSTPPTPAGTPRLGPLLADLQPSLSPTQVGPDLAGAPLPSSQWWTSALTGPWTQPLWAVPVVAQAGPDGLALSVPTVRTEPDHVLSDPAPQLVVGGALSAVAVEAYGDFSVRLGLTRTDGSRVGVDLAQGCPVVHLDVPAGRLELTSRGATPVSASGGLLRVGQWEVLAGASAVWSVDGLRASTVLAQDGSVALAPRPSGAGPAWDAALAAATRTTDTLSTVAVDRRAGRVTQVLEWVDGSGPVVTTPVQRAAGAPDADLLGTYESARGELQVVGAARLELSVPLREPDPAVTALELAEDERTAVLADLRRDVASSVVGGGIYDDGKALGRLALLADIAHALSGDGHGAGDEVAEVEARAVAALGAGLRDWLSYEGSEDQRWLAHEPTWGTITANPPQFGSQDLNDHHFHFGYLIRAAATLQRLTGGDERGLDVDARAAVGLLVDDVIGTDAPHPDLPLPRFRVWNAYLGHSAASGFAPFADGNNQESSSEAVHAWEAIADWGRVTGDDALTDRALGHWCLEASAARSLWLGESTTRPAGYDHTVVGIVWDGKLDFATFFDARPEAVIGIQLLPFTPGSVYRDDPRAAADRVETARAAGGGTPRLWPDLFVMEQALADPAAALSALADVETIEAGNSRAWLRWWVLSRRAS